MEIGAINCIINCMTLSCRQACHDAHIPAPSPYVHIINPSVTSKAFVKSFMTTSLEKYQIAKFFKRAPLVFVGINAGSLLKKIRREKQGSTWSCTNLKRAALTFPGLQEAVPCQRETDRERGKSAQTCQICMLPRQPFWTQVKGM